MPKTYKTYIPMMLQWPVTTGKSLLSLIFLVNLPQHICNLDCAIAL